VELGGGHTNSPELSLLNFLPLNYYHSHFLAATFDFTLFHPGILGPHTFFTACCFCIDMLDCPELGPLREADI